MANSAPYKVDGDIYQPISPDWSQCAGYVASLPEDHFEQIQALEWRRVLGTGADLLQFRGTLGGYPRIISGYDIGSLLMTAAEMAAGRQ